jgi:hypothetical protein
MKTAQKEKLKEIVLVSALLVAFRFIQRKLRQTREQISLKKSYEFSIAVPTARLYVDVYLQDRLIGGVVADMAIVF